MSPRVNYKDTPMPEGFSPVPVGDYLCKIIDVNVGSTEDNSEMWNVTFEIIEGEFAGRRIWDRWVFSSKEAARSRMKLILDCLGVDTSKELDVTADMVIDSTVKLQIYVQDYHDADTGEPKQSNKVKFAGYGKVEQPKKKGKQDKKTKGGESDLPF